MTALPVPGLTLAPVTEPDLAELYVMQRCCWLTEALVNDTLAIPPLHESLDDMRAWVRDWSGWIVRRGPRLVAGVRARRDGDAWEIGRLFVAPDLLGLGLGRWLLAYAEAQAPDSTAAYTLYTGERSVRNITMYERAGYRLIPDAEVPGGHIAGAVHLRKPRT